MTFEFQKSDLIKKKDLEEYNLVTAKPPHTPARYRVPRVGEEKRERDSEESRFRCHLL